MQWLWIESGHTDGDHEEGQFRLFFFFAQPNFANLSRFLSLMQETLFVDVESIAHMITDYNEVINSLTKSEVMHRVLYAQDIFKIINTYGPAFTIAGVLPAQHYTVD